VWENLGGVWGDEVFSSFVGLGGVMDWRRSVVRSVDEIYFESFLSCDA
jgi:hypothetical protein